MREKRRFIRFSVNLKVDYILQGKQKKIERSGTTKDVSAGGIQLITEELLSPEDTLELKVFLPGASNPVHMKGKVLWINKFGQEKNAKYSAGVKFIDVEEDNKNTFLDFLCNLMYGRVK